MTNVMKPAKLMSKGCLIWLWFILITCVVIQYRKVLADHSIKLSRIIACQKQVDMTGTKECDASTDEVMMAKPCQLLYIRIQ